MAMYTLNKSLLYQRHYDIEKSMSMYDYVSNNLDKEFDEVYYIVANKDNKYNLNVTGGLILEELDKGRSVDEIAERLNKIFKADYQEVKEDVIDFINYLESVKIIIDEEGK